MESCDAKQKTLMRIANRGDTRDHVSLARQVGKIIFRGKSPSEKC